MGLDSLETKKVSILSRAQAVPEGTHCLAIFAHEIDANSCVDDEAMGLLYLLLTNK
jgi:hypothetical protein